MAPILFGLDKFLNLMTDWTEFLPAFITDMVSGGVVMGIVGVVESQPVSASGCDRRSSPTSWQPGSI